MNKKLITTLFILVSVLTMGFAQNITLKGVVKSKQTQQGLKDVNISIPKLKKGAVTDTQGNFSIVLPQGKYKMRITSIGYESKVLTVNTQRPEKVAQIFLEELITGLGEVSITGTRTQLKDDGRTTTKLNVPLKDVPMTVSTLDKKVIDQLQVTSINDAMRYTTGVKPTVNYGGFQTFKLRGLGKPVIMVDGARDERMNFSNSAPVTSLAAVERIEYLKGPASVTYGHSADGGIINIIRKQPTEDFTANFSAYYGSWNNKGAVVGAGGKLSDKINYRFDASFADKDGWRDFAEKTVNGYLALDYNIDTKNKIEVRFGANDDFYATETGFPVFGTTIFDEAGKEIYHKGDLVKSFDISQRYNDPQDYLKHENVNASAKYIHNFSKDSKLTFHTSYTDDYINYFSTESLSFPTSDEAKFNHYFESNGAKKYIDLKHIYRSYPFRFAHDTQTFQNSLDYTTTLKSGNIKHNILGGAFLMILDRTTFTGYGSNDIFGPGKNATITIVNPTLNQGFIGEKFSGAKIYDETILGLYAQDLIEFSPQIKALVALRLDHYKMNFHTAKVDYGKHKTDHTPKNSMKHTPLSYRLGLVYEPIEPLSLYASFSNFFRPNRTSYSENNIYLDKNGKQFDPINGDAIFDPQTGFQTEVGFKYNLNSKVQLSGSAYYINKEGIIETLKRFKENGVNKKIIAQVGEVESKGFEIDATVKPLNGLTITGGYSFCDAKYKEFSSNDYDAPSKKGNALARTPKNQFFMWSFYEVPEGALKNLNFGFGINYTDKMFTNYSASNNDLHLPSYWLTEATVGYKLNNNVYFKFKVNNMFDEEYFSNSVMSNQFIPGAERNFLFTIGYKL